ncbi:MAG: anti-sigma factor antagonist, partial [Actinomycetota bacterium]|nr:anti-sigma factor antagonist [Actinomycetota bacterium]
MQDRVVAQQSPSPLPSMAGPADEHLRWFVTSVRDEVVVALQGEMDMANADGLGRALAAVLETRPSKVTVDLESLSFLDSSGIRCLVIASQQASAVRSKFVVRRPGRAVLRVLQLTGTDTMLLEGSDGHAA